MKPEKMKTDVRVGGDEGGMIKLMEERRKKGWDENLMEGKGE